MRKPLSVVIITLSAAFSLPNASAEGPMSFSYLGHESCVAGAPGTFTVNGDVTNFYGMFPAYGSGTLVFDANRSTASDINNDWDYQQIPPIEPQLNTINGSPLGIFPQRTTTGTCFSNFKLMPDLSFTLDSIPGRCTAVDTSGPNAGNTVTFYNSPQMRGQFSADMQSFVMRRIGLGVETGYFAFGGAFDRICMREMHGVRLPHDNFGR